MRSLKLFTFKFSRTSLSLSYPRAFHVTSSLRAFDQQTALRKTQTVRDILRTLKERNLLESPREALGFLKALGKSTGQPEIVLSLVRASIEATDLDTAFGILRSQPNTQLHFEDLQNLYQQTLFRLEFVPKLVQIIVQASKNGLVNPPSLGKAFSIADSNKSMRLSLKGKGVAPKAESTIEFQNLAKDTLRLCAQIGDRSSFQLLSVGLPRQINDFAVVNFLARYLEDDTRLGEALSAFNHLSSASIQVSKDVIEIVLLFVSHCIKLSHESQLIFKVLHVVANFGITNCRPILDNLVEAALVTNNYDAADGIWRLGS
jgi:hypothetical protein